MLLQNNGSYEEIEEALRIIEKTQPEIDALRHFFEEDTFNRSR